MDKKEASKALLRNFRNNYAKDDQIQKINVLLEKIEDKEPFYEKNYEEVSLNNLRNDEFLEDNHKENDSGEYEEVEDFN